MIFGRAGEEIDVLGREGIGYDVVPGITAGIAMAAAFGVSLDPSRPCQVGTLRHRPFSQVGGLPEDIDWRAVADPSATTIFYMAGRTAAGIATRLVSMGCSSKTPVAVAASLGRRDQVLHRTTLQGLAATVGRIGCSKPLIVGVGQAFELRRPAVTATLPADKARHL